MKLIPIGKIVRNNIILDNDYINCMKKIDMFSHIHLFYKSNNILRKTIVKISNVSNNLIEFIIDSNKCKFIDNEYVLYDIKPYMPSEDSIYSKQVDVKSFGICNVSNSNEISNQSIIRVVNNETFIEFNNSINDLNYQYLNVYWWFNKFDNKMYRMIKTIDPPYDGVKNCGIFLTRSPVRPNPIAYTIVKVERYDYYNNRIYINGIEAYDMTPCIGVSGYDQNNDFVSDVNIPSYLSSWPKHNHFIDYENQNNNDYISSSLPQVLKNNKPRIIKEEPIKYNQNEIFIKGAKTNNLKNIDVKIPYNKITAVVGVSGSGKSSLVKDTLYKESIRRMEHFNLNNNSIKKANVDYISGVIPSIMIDQRPIRKNSMSVVGTYTNCLDYLRILYSIIGIRHCTNCGREIIKLSKEEIISLVKRLNIKNIYDLNKNEIEISSIKYDLKTILDKSPIYIKYNNEYLLLQTEEKCYFCNKVIFKITPSSFSYNNIDSRCDVCNGRGKVVVVDTNTLVKNENKSLLDGAIPFYGNLRDFIKKPNANWMKGQVFALAKEMNVDLSLPWKDLPPLYKQKLIEGSNELVTFEYNDIINGKKGSITKKVEGLKNIIMRLSTDTEKYKRNETCKVCNGERLKKEGRIVTINNIRYPIITNYSFLELLDFLKEVETTIDDKSYELTKDVINLIKELCNNAISLGIEYLKMNTEINNLSNGENQRLKLLSIYNNHMHNLLYILDEPSRGLDARDYNNVARMLKKIVSENNTVLMVEHNEEMIKKADYLIELGPKAGSEGGYVVGEDNIENIINNSNTEIAKYLNMDNYIINRKRKTNTTFIKLTNLCSMYLKNINIDIPINRISAIYGVSGSGKTTLLKKEIYPKMLERKIFSDVIFLDQSPIGKNSKSIVGSYTKVLDMIRDLFANTDEAKKLGYTPSHFSFNKLGKCERCDGEGELSIPFVDDVSAVCPDCNGKRYNKDILNVYFKGKNIDDILNLTISEALIFFNEDTMISNTLKYLQKVGLGYIKLGQKTSTLSGGESQRVRLAMCLVNSTNVMYLLDEPTMGLHFSDITNLLKLLFLLIDEGNTVMVIEHNKQFLDNCDYLIELGPKANINGGEVVNIINRCL